MDGITIDQKSKTIRVKAGIGYSPEVHAAFMRAFFGITYILVNGKWTNINDSR